MPVCSSQTLIRFNKLSAEPFCMWTQPMLGAHCLCPHCRGYSKKKVNNHVRTKFLKGSKGYMLIIGGHSNGHLFQGSRFTTRASLLFISAQKYFIFVINLGVSWWVFSSCYSFPHQHNAWDKPASWNRAQTFEETGKKKKKKTQQNKRVSSNTDTKRCIYTTLK